MKIILFHRFTTGFHRFTTGRLVLLDIFVWYCKGRVREWTLKVVFFLPGETEAKFSRSLSLSIFKRIKASTKF